MYEIVSSSTYKVNGKTKKKVKKKKKRIPLSSSKNDRDMAVDNSFVRSESMFSMTINKDNADKFTELAEEEKSSRVFDRVVDSGH